MGRCDILCSLELEDQLHIFIQEKERCDILCSIELEDRLHILKLADHTPNRQYLLIDRVTDAL